MAGLLNKIKNDAKKSGGNKGKIFYIREGEKKRVRFLTDMDDGLDITFHDSYEAGINTPCQDLYGRDCPYCDDDSVRTRSMYCWSVWDYDAKEVKLFMYAVNNCSPVPAMIALHENYGTLCDRDYVIGVSGKQQNKTFSVIPQDKAKFRNDRAKPLAKKAILDILDKAFPCDGADDEDDDYDDTPKKKKGTSSSSDESLYEDMSARELYELCKERDIDAEKKKPAKYYIELLEEYDEENEEDAWADEDEDGNEVDYSELSARELYDMCKSRKIDCAPKKPAKYYINLLEEDDAAHDDWEDDEDGETDDWED
jgi:hypothetical protein